MYRANKRHPMTKGFTLVELVVVIIVLVILASVLLPRLLNLSADTRITALNGVAGAMQSTVNLVRAQARASGISVFPSNPGDQTQLIIDIDGRTTEVDWRNLCPEASAELGDALDMVDFMDLQLSGGLTQQTNNRYTLVGYDIPGFSVPTNRGCYIIYDSFGDPDCTITVVTTDC